MRSIPFSLLVAALALLAFNAPAAEIAPVPPVPTPSQRAWQELEQTMFIHFGVNTFSDREWGDGKEDPKSFNPATLDARQWARAAKAGGFKLMILTAKHHDGFCLWPSRYTEHSVKHAAWKDGQGDVVREFVAACRAEGLKVGLYLSPWDRHETSYGTDAYNRHFTNQLAELLTDYGKIDEVWFDGACGEGPNGKKQIYDWPSYFAAIRRLAPEAVIAIQGPDVRWVGNESGVARVGESSVQSPRADVHGTTGEKIWYPAECDVSLRPGWFYHAAEDGRVKSLAHLLDIYFKSVGRNSVLLLNVPPNRDGLFADPDVRRLQEFGDAVRAISGSVVGGFQRGIGSEAFRVAPPGEGSERSFEVAANPEQPFNLVSLREPFWLGERAVKYRLEAQPAAESAWQVLARGQAIGSRNLVPVPETGARRVRLVIEASRGEPALTEFALLNTPHAPRPPVASLAAHKPAKASNVHPSGTTFGADRAVDADSDTRWATSDDTRACWLEVDLGRAETFGRVTISELAPRVQRFQIESRSAKDAPWLVAFTGTGKDREHTHAFAPVTGRFVRLNILEASAPPTIWEFQVFAK